LAEKLDAPVDPLYALAPLLSPEELLITLHNPWLQFHLDTLATHFDHKSRMSQDLGSASPQSSSSYAVPQVVGAPLSPRSTAAILAAKHHIPKETMQEIAAGLLRTIKECESTHNRELHKLHERVKSLEELLGDEQDDEPPEGFIRNNGKIRNFDIPMGDGLHLPAKFICQHPGDYTKAEGLTGKEFSSESPYSIKVYAAPDLQVDEVPELLLLWVQTIIEGRTATFESLCQAVIELADFGIVTDLTRARDTYLKAQEMELQWDQIEADLDLLCEKYALTCGCLELAHVSKRLARQQYLVPAVLQDDENFPRVPPKTHNMKQGRFAV
jgi:hypothetical protein